MKEINKEREILLQLLDEEFDEYLKRAIFIDCLKKSESDSQIEECIQKLNAMRMDIEDIYGFIKDIFYHDSNRLIKYIKLFHKILGDTKESNEFLAGLIYNYFCKIVHRNERYIIDELKEGKHNFPEKISTEIIKRIKTKDKKVREVENKKLSLLSLTEWKQTLRLLNVYSNEEMEAGTSIKDYILILLLHFLNDLCGFLAALNRVEASAENIILIHKNYPYPNINNLRKYLVGSGYKIYSIEKIEEAINEAISQAKIKNKKIIIVEDGGYLTEAIHKNYKEDIKIFHGAVEQTSKGIKRIKQIQLLLNSLEFPVLNVAESEIKSEFEPPAIAETVIRNIKNLLIDIKLRGKIATVIGYGRIGKQIAIRLRESEKMKVCVYDSDPEKLASAHDESFETDEYLPNLLKSSYLIIGATGNMTIGENEILCLNNGSILVSASSDQEEIGISILKILSREDPVEKCIGNEYILINENKILLLGRGYPINFFGTESIPNEISDLVLAELYLSTIALASKKDLKKDINRNFVDKLVSKRNLIERYRKFTS